jgi:competence protein ComEC
VIALVTDKRALGEDCARADILISRREAPPGCTAKHILDRPFLAAHGATAIRLPAAGDPVVTTARRSTDVVPWRPLRPPKSTAAPANTVPATPKVLETDEPDLSPEGSGEPLQ